MRKITIAITVIEAIIIILIASYITLYQAQKSVQEKPFISVTGNVITPNLSSQISFRVDFDLTEGHVTLPIIYGNGTHFLGAGLSDIKEFAVSDSKIITLNRNINPWFVLSQKINGINNSYALELESVTSEGGIEKARFKSLITSNFLDSKQAGENITQGQTTITVVSVNSTTKNVTLNISLSPGETYLDRIIDSSGEYLIIPSKTNFPRTNYTLNILDSSGSIVKKYDAYWSSSIMYINQTYGPQTSQCASNWTAYNTSCNSNEIMITYHMDSNNCPNGTAPQNITLYCDYDNNGIIGSSSSMNFIRVNPKVKINGSELNLTGNYSNLQLVEILDDNISLIEMQWDFSVPLVFSSMKIEKQNASASAGYIIINGINRNKTVYLSKISSSSNSVCIRDSEVSSIDSIGQLCDGANEWKLICPGSNQSFSCEITSDNRFKVSGIMHSAVKENIPVNFTPACTPQTCSSLGKNCGSIQESSCNITLNCGSCESGFTCSENICVEETPACTPNWNCTSWKPSTCPKTGNQTRTCTDKNNCGITEGKPEVKRTCTPETPKSNAGIWIFIGLLVLLGIIAAAVLIWLKLRNKSGNINPVGGPGIQFPPSAPPVNPQFTEIKAVPPSWMPQQPMPPLQAPATPPIPAQSQTQLPAPQSNSPQNNQI